MGGTTLYLGYLAAFGAAAVVCFTGVARVRRIEDPDTRRGLVGLLITSGAWASAHVAFLLVPTPQLKTAMYLAGLVVGFSSVGSWLYFCSAYTGRSLHRNQLVRRSAVAVFIAVVAVKITNPIHQLYFTTELVSAPFPHLAVHNGLLHWLAMGLAYALATVGYFMLFELFTQVNYDTKPFAVLIALTGLPIVFDVVGVVSPQVVEISYEPLGVAVFAVGVLYVYSDRFQAIRLTGESDDPVLVLSEEDRIRDYNANAESLFPVLTTPNALGAPLEAVLPQLADSSESDASVIELEREGTKRYYRVTENPFGADQTNLGRLLIVTDITHREQYRQELERQNGRLEQFANVVSHDLRNPLNVATGRLALARDERDSEHLAEVSTALSRMDSLIDDVLTLARQGQPIAETEQVSLSSVADQCWRWVNTGEADLVVESDVRFVADVDRLQQLLENLFRNAIEHGGDVTTVRVGALDATGGFYVADDGVGIPAEERQSVFESGYSTTRDGTGFGLAIVKEIADAHGWTIRITESNSGGTQFEVTELETGT